MPFEASLISGVLKVATGVGRIAQSYVLHPFLSFDVSAPCAGRGVAPSASCRPHLGTVTTWAD